MNTIRERIITACANLMQEKGLYKLTVDEIASAAGLSKRTIYRYFASKDEIIEATLTTVMEEVGQQFADILERDLRPEEIFPQLFGRLFKHGTKIINPKVMSDLQTHYPHYWLKIDQYRIEKVRHFIMYILEKSNQEREPKLDPRIISSVIIAAVQNVLTPDFLLRNNLSFEGVGQQVVDFFQYGLFKQHTFNGLPGQTSS